MKLLIISLPLFSSFFIFFFGRYIGYKGAKIISISSTIYCIFASCYTFFEFLKGKIYIIKIKEWFNIGILKTDIEFIYDKESIIMNNLISIITFIVITYSFWYLSEDPHINRFISYLLIFSVSMFILVTSKNFFLTFLGWEGVGIISYLLINFWFFSPNNNKSSIKAVLFNKIGDIFYLFALILLSFFFYNFDINSFNFYTPALGYNLNIFKYILFFFLFASIAKSAQIFLHCWLGDAMAGPTPVSALLHAATMVTAGIYLMIRCNNLIIPINNIINNYDISFFIITIGLLTILFAGLSSLSQFDIKKVIAYSTCAQIGFMFFALILYYPKFGSIFHLFTHGFFKALLFLSAGLLIHNLLNEQDLRKYGSFIFSSPLFYIFFLIGSFAIIAFPPFSGFFSKDSILIHSLFSDNLYLFFFLLLGSFFSSLYSFKILFLSFFNLSSNQTPQKNLNLENNFQIYFFPFILLLLGSIFLGYFSSSFFLSPENISLDLEFSSVYQSKAIRLKIFIFFLPFFALLFFYIFFVRSWYFSNFFSPLVGNIFSLFNRRFFFDPLYNYFLILPSLSFSYHIFYKFIDRGILEILGPLGFFRLFFFSPSFFSQSPKLKYIKNNFYSQGSLYFQSSSNLPYLFFYFFFGFLFLLFFSFFFLPQ